MSEEPELSDEEAAKYWWRRCGELEALLKTKEAELEAARKEAEEAREERDAALTKWHAHKKNVPCSGCVKGHDTYWKSVVESPQWAEWRKIAEWDTAECEACGHISAEHFQAFLAFVKQPAESLVKSLGMVRTLDGNVRALLSNRYRPLENWDLANAVLPAIQAAGCRVESAELTERRFYIKAVTEKLSLEVKKGDVVQAGIVVSNSEVGMGGVRVEPMIYRLVCSNGMIAADQALRKYHVGRGFGGDEEGAEELYRDETRLADDKAFWMKARDVVNGSLQKDVFERIAKRITEAASEAMSGDPVKVVEVAQKRLGLSEEERGGVLRHLIQGGDLSRWGMVNAITRASQDVQSYDRATDLERMGGAVLELPKSDWAGIANAK